MREIVERLQENRQIELAKSILENAGYEVTPSTDYQTLRVERGKSIVPLAASIVTIKNSRRSYRSMHRQQPLEYLKSIASAITKSIDYLEGGDISDYLCLNMIDPNSYYGNEKFYKLAHDMQQESQVVSTHQIPLTGYKGEDVKIATVADVKVLQHETFGKSALFMLGDDGRQGFIRMWKRQTP